MNSNSDKPKAGFIIPKYSKYNTIWGWYVIITGLSVMEFKTKAEASEWMKFHGYDVAK